MVTEASSAIRTPDQRLRVFVSSTLEELGEERRAAREAIEHLRLTPVLFELGARPYPPRPLYRAYLAQSDIFIGIYWQRYGWTAPGEELSGLEDEYHLATDRPKLIYVKAPAPECEPHLSRLLDRIRDDDGVSYKLFETAGELRDLIENDLALVLSESFALAQFPGPGGRTQQSHDSLPVQRNQLVDRTSVTAAVRRLLLQEDVGLVTLTGAGGSGKTRLALHVAATLRSSFEDGVHFVPLASVADPDLVISAIAQTLHVWETPDQPLLETLSDYMYARHLLLLLDNFEHLLDATPMVSLLLQRCPKLTILATSRSLLHLREEREIRVPPLEVPDVQALPELAQLSQYGAVELFVQRAREVKPGFEVTNETAPAVAGICQRLDGLPLAIELAASRVKLFPPKNLLSRLERRLPLLVTGARDLPERQQTLHSAIEWSYDLLDGDEKRLLRRLSVFVGGFTLNAAHAVCEMERALPMQEDAGRGESSAFLAGVESLLDKSLLWVQEGPGGEPRFGMLETIGEYAEDRLAESDEQAKVQRRHSDVYLNLAETAEPELAKAKQVAWLGRLEADHDNLRAALERSLLPNGDIEVGLRLGGALWRFWYIRGHRREGRAWLEKLVARAGKQATATRAGALRGAGGMAYGQRRYDEAARLFTDALRIYQELRDPEGEAACLNSLAVLRDEQGDGRAARALHEEVLARRRELGDTSGIAQSVGNLGALAHREGHYRQARTLYEEGLALEHELGNIGGAAITLSNLGELAIHSGDPRRAAPFFGEGLELGAELGDREIVTNCLDGLGYVAFAYGQLPQAVRLHGAAEGIRATAELPIRPTEIPKYEVHVAGLRHALGERAFARGWRKGLAMPLEQAVSEALTVAEADPGCPGEHREVLDRESPHIDEMSPSVK